MRLSHCSITTVPQMESDSKTLESAHVSTYNILTPPLILAFLPVLQVAWPFQIKLIPLLIPSYKAPACSNVARSFGTQWQKTVAFFNLLSDVGIRLHQNVLLMDQSSNLLGFLALHGYWRLLQEAVWKKLKSEVCLFKRAVAPLSQLTCEPLVCRMRGSRRFQGAGVRFMVCGWLNTVCITRWQCICCIYTRFILQWSGGRFDNDITPTIQPSWF